MADDSTYEIHAIRYGFHVNPSRALCFLTKDFEDTEPCRLDYFFWVAKSRDRTILIDTGASVEEGVKRNRRIDFRPRDGLAKLGIDAAEISDVIITHMHWDHAGTPGDFPNARIHVQRLEMEYVTGPCMRHTYLRTPFSVDHITEMVRLLHQGRVILHDGDADILPGVSIHLIGGHSKGLQCVRLHTTRGAVVLASDVAHYYDNFRTGFPFYIVYDMEATLRGYERLFELADSPDHIIPGHDPDVLRLYPASAPGLEDVAVRVDVPPATA